MIVMPSDSDPTSDSARSNLAAVEVVHKIPYIFVEGFTANFPVLNWSDLLELAFPYNQWL